MLTFKLETNPDTQRRILTVKETTFSANTTRINHWNYDIDAWLRSTRGYEFEEPTRPCLAAEIEWVRRFYFPKVGLDREGRAIK